MYLHFVTSSSDRKQSKKKMIKYIRADTDLKIDHLWKVVI